MYIRKEWVVLGCTHLAAAVGGAVAWHVYATRVNLEDDVSDTEVDGQLTFWDAAEEFITWSTEAEEIQVISGGEVIARVGSDDVPSAPPTREEESAAERFIKEQLETGEDELPAEVVNIFGDVDDAGADGLWDWASELESRELEDIYILHETEYFAKEMPDYDQSTMLWYVEDSLLADENEVLVYNVQDVVGELMFGHGAKDEDKFYVRNDKLRTEYEVIRVHGSYEVEVLNRVAEQAADDEELKHSMRTLKFRTE